MESMSCQYVLTGHTETVLCLDTSISSSGKTLIVSGSKDKDVSFTFLCLLVRLFYSSSHLGYFISIYRMNSGFITIWSAICLIRFLYLKAIFLHVQVRLWDSESGLCLGVGKGHMGAVGAVALSKKGKPFFVSGSR